MKVTPSSLTSYPFSQVSQEAFRGIAVIIIPLYKVVSFLSVEKDLSNRWADVVLLYNEASCGSSEPEGYLNPREVATTVIFVVRNKLQIYFRYLN